MHVFSRFSLVVVTLAGFALRSHAATPRPTGTAPRTTAAAPAKKETAPKKETSSSSSSSARQLGDIEVVVDTQTVPVRVTASTPELQDLALRAFNAHGRYDLRGLRPPAFEIKFTAAGGNQVRVDVTRASAPVVSQVVTGTSPRNALFRAADVAVEKTNGLGLRGFFAAKLAFISQRTGRTEVYSSDLFFGEAKQLTHDNAHALTPRWSPDGSRIIYTSYYKSGFPDIFLIDAGSATKSTFVSVRGTNTGARFSPTGQQVAMVLTGEGPSEIYVSNAQGRQIARKTRVDVPKSSPCWSPDGNQIAFAMGEPAPQIYTMPASGGTPQRLFSGYGYAAEPDWCRVDRNKVACTVRAGSYQIAVFDATKGKAAIVSKAPFDGVEPCWLADGRHLVYTARDGRTSVLCILDTETGRSTAISGRGEQAMQANAWW